MTQELGPNLKRIQDFFQQLDVHERIEGDLFFLMWVKLTKIFGCIVCLGGRESFFIEIDITKM